MSHSNEIKLLMRFIHMEDSERNSNGIFPFAKQKPDWEKIVRIAGQNDVASVFFYNLSRSGCEGLVPLDIREKLKKSYHQISYRNIMVVEELKKILILFGNAGIDVIPLKGVSLLGKVWGNPALRPMADIDVLVPKKDIRKAEDLMAGTGYIADESYHPKAWYWKNHFHIAPYFDPSNKIPIEVHHHVVRPGGPIRLDMDKFWRHAGDDMVDGIPVKCLSTEDMFMHLCVHLFINSTCVGTIKHLLDIAAYLNHYKETIDWTIIERDGGNYGIINVIYYSLYTANRILGARVDQKIIGRFKRQCSKIYLHDYFIKKMVVNSIIFDYENYWFPDFYHQHFFTELLNETTMLKKLTSFSELLFPISMNSSTGNSNYIIRKKKYAYCISRLINLMAKLIGNLMGHIKIRMQRA